MNSDNDSDLYGDDIRLWSERQGALLRRLANEEAVFDQLDWPHVVEEIEDLGQGDAHRPVQDKTAQLTARLAAAEALVKELRARLDNLTGKLASTQAELASTQDQVETATARAMAAVQTEQVMRQAEAARKGQGRWAREGTVEDRVNLAMPEVGMRAPVIDSLSPAQVLAGSGDNVVAVLGQNFRSPAQCCSDQPTDPSIRDWVPSPRNVRAKTAGGG
jgi:Domain of unknown function DUF29